MTMPLPPRWASNTNYSAGPDTGSPTKVDPASQADGYIRGVAAAAQQVNFVINPLADMARKAFETAALKLREIRRGGVAFTDLAESMAAVQRNVGAPLVAIKTAQAFGLGEWPFFSAQGVPTQITSLVNGAATNGTQIVAIGTGGSGSSVSSDDGATWANAGAVGISGAGTRLIYSARGGSPFIYAACKPSSTNIKFSDPVSVGVAGAWANLLTGVTAPQDLAAYDPDGTHAELMVLSGTTTPAFYTSKSGGSLLGTTVPNSGTADESGSLAGNGGTTIYHVFRRTSGTLLQVSASLPTDAPAAAWISLATIAPPSGLGFASRPRIFMCQNTGLLVIAAPLTSSQLALYASIGGIEWVGPTLLFPNPGVEALAVAGGRLLATFDDQLFASDGIGF